MPPADLTVRALLTGARASLLNAGIDDAALEARVLLAHVLGAEPAALLIEPDRPVAAAQADAFTALLARRLMREPSAYIIGEREFYGLSLKVDRRALVPRPETELLVEEALGAAREMGAGGPLIADVCTGSGCIAVSLAVHLPTARLYALDISADALSLAAENAARHGVTARITFLQGDLLAPLGERRVDVIVANPPYVPDENLRDIQPEIRRYEPRVAVAGGPDGLVTARRLLTHAPGALRPGGRLFMEVGHGQASDVVEAARTAFPDAAVDMAPDLAGIPRVLRVRLPA